MTQDEIVLSRSLGRLEGKVDSLISLYREQRAAAAERAAEIRSELTILQTRASALEAWRTYLAGAAGTALAVVAALSTVIWRILP